MILKIIKLIFVLVVLIVIHSSATKGLENISILNDTEDLLTKENYSEEIFILNNQNSIFWLNRGYVLENLSKYKEAFESFNKSANLNSYEKEAWYGKGRMLEILGNYKDALYFYNVALSIDKNDTKVWNSRGHNLNKMGNYEEALINYDTSLKINPYYKDAWYNRANTLILLQNYSEALESYSKVLKLSPNDTNALIGKGNSLMSLGRYSEALTEYDNAKAIEPENSLVWYYRGSALYFMGNLSDAKISNQMALKYFKITKKLNINATLEVEPDLRDDQIGVVGKTYPLLIEFYGEDDFDLSDNIHIEFLKNGNQIILNNNIEIKDVIVDEKNYWRPLIYNLGLKLNRKLLLNGQNDSFRINVTFLSPGIYSIIVTTHERKVFAVQIVDQLTMRDLKNEITSLQVSQESKEIAQRSQAISLIAPFITFAAAIVVTFMSFYLTKRHNKQIVRMKFLNLVNTKLDKIVASRETWIYKDYKIVKDNFVSLSNEIANIIQLVPDDFSDDILNELLNITKELYDFSTYNFIDGEDKIFEEKTLEIVNKAKEIKKKMK